MRNFKKLLPVILTMSLMIASLSGCGTTKDKSANTDASVETQTPDSETTGSPEENADWDGEVSHIIVTYLTTGAEPKDIKEVEGAVNKITVPKIGVEIEFKSLSIFESMSQYSMWIASGDPLDVAIVAFTDIANYANQGMLLPLEENISKNAPYIEQLGKDIPIYDASIVKGSTYGIRVIPPSFGSEGGYLITKDSLESAGLNYKNNTKITLDDLTNIFAAINTANPDIYPCGVVGSLPSFKYTTIYDALGATESSGVLIGTDSTKVVDMYESEEYYNYLKHMRDWYEKGYIEKDAATSEATLIEKLSSNTISGIFSEGLPSAAPLLAKDIKKDVIQLDILDPYLKSTASTANSYFTIPVTCSNPDAAMRFINMLYENSDLANLIQMGIKDKHYVMKDQTSGLIAFPEGVDAATSGYYNPMGLWGDQRSFYIWDESGSQGNYKGFSDKALANPTKAVGFTYDPTAMTNQIIAIDAVVNEYRAALETGSADLDSNYKEFIDKLKLNSIDKVVADKQKQFDVWLAQQK